MKFHETVVEVVVINLFNITTNSILTDFDNHCCKMGTIFVLPDLVIVRNTCKLLDMQWKFNDFQ